MKSQEEKDRTRMRMDLPLFYHVFHETLPHGIHECEYFGRFNNLEAYEKINKNLERKDRTHMMNLPLFYHDFYETLSHGVHEGEL